MLAPASQYQSQLSDLWSLFVADPKFVYWNVDFRYNPAAEIRNTDYRKDEFVSVLEGKVVGYLCALIDTSTRSVADVSAASFYKTTTFSKDFLTFLKNLRRRYRIIRWATVEGHPNQETYEKIAKRYGGRVVGTFKNKIRLHNGRLYNERWYEIA